MLFPVAYVFSLSCFSASYLQSLLWGISARLILVTFKKNICLLITDRDLILTITAFFEKF